MTTEMIVEVTCSLCKFTSKQTEITSTNELGSMDLDTRPSEMKRSTITTWVQRCPECGACASKIDKQDIKIRHLLQKKDYQNQINDSELPELANSFLCRAIIEEHEENLSYSFWSTVHACWAIDDLGEPNKAIEIRKKSIERLFKADSRGQQVAPAQNAKTAILIDLLRRSGSFAEASMLIEEEEVGNSEDLISRVLKFQKYLIERESKKAYMICDINVLADKDLAKQHQGPPIKPWWKIF